MTAGHDHDDLNHRADRLTPRQADRLRLPAASDPDLAPATGPRGETGKRPLSITGIWESGRGDLSERHDEIIRERAKRSARQRC